MIYIKKIRYKNLLSTGNVFTELDLCSKETTLIVGTNGAGKSTILDALSFALFGKPFRKINKPQLVNSITQKNMVVELEFSIGTVEYKIVRGIKPNVFEVYQNGKLLNQSAESKDYQEILEQQIIKVNYKSFSQVVVLGSATFQPFMQLSASQKREVIEDLLDLQIFSTMNSVLKDKVLQNSESISKNEYDRKLIQSKIELTEQHVFEMNTNTAQIVEDKNTLISKLTSEALSLIEELKTYDKDISELEQSIKDNESISKKIETLSKLKHQIEAKKALMDHDIKFFNDHDNCPTCKQDIEEAFRHKTIEIKKDQIREIEESLKTLSEQYDRHNARLNEIMEVNNLIQSKRMEKIRCQTSISSIKTNVIQLKDDIEKIKEVKTVDKDEKISEYNKELDSIAVEYNELVEDKNILSAAGVMLKDNGIKAKIIKQYVPIINKLINKYLSAMDFFVSFELDENFNEKIKSRYRDDFTYSSFSEGEKQKIDLALLFTWRAIAKLRNSINTNILIMDEVFDSSLDQNSTEYLMNIIREVAKDSNIIIISHKEHMNEKFNNVIKFIKTKNFSTIQESSK
jgi:DNA repair exonuclease SbcCD ATPase subunit